MYERFYELRERPFALSPDPDYLYPSRVHREALDYLRYGLESHAGFVVITGEIGSGKTTLLQTLLRGVDSQTTVGRIVNTLGGWPQALRDVATESGVTLIDLNRMTTDQLESVGREASKALFMWIAPGQWASLPQGRQDDTHYVEGGARATAALAAQALRQQVPALHGWFREPGTR